MLMLGPTAGTGTPRDHCEQTFPEPRNLMTAPDSASQCYLAFGELDTEGKGPPTFTYCREEMCSGLRRETWPRRRSSLPVFRTIKFWVCIIPCILRSFPNIGLFLPRKFSRVIFGSLTHGCQGILGKNKKIKSSTEIHHYHFMREKRF